jgi:hypothetical protein
VAYFLLKQDMPMVPVALKPQRVWKHVKLKKIKTNVSGLVVLSNFLIMQTVKGTLMFARLGIHSLEVVVSAMGRAQKIMGKKVV